MKDHYFSYHFLEKSENQKNVRYCIFPWGGRSGPLLNTDHLCSCHTLPDSVNNGCPTDSKFCNPFVSVRMRFLSVSCAANAFLVRRCPFNPVESFGHAQNLERTPPAKGIRWLYGYCALSMRFGRYSSVPCPVLVRSHPVFDRWT